MKESHKSPLSAAEVKPGMQFGFDGRTWEVTVVMEHGFTAKTVDNSKGRTKRDANFWFQG